LREHEGGEFFAGKFSGAVEKGAVEIFVDGNLTGVECGEGEIVAVLEFFVVEVKSVSGRFAGVAVPAVGEDDAADIPEECGDVKHGRVSFREDREEGREDSTSVGERETNGLYLGRSAVFRPL
jgi:hypothetical protein